MAKYFAQDAHLYRFQGKIGYIECKCGLPAMICNGNHTNCSLPNPQHWPICKHCGKAIEAPALSRLPTTNHQTPGMQYLWTEVECDPKCAGYGIPITAAPNAPAAPTLQKTKPADPAPEVLTYDQRERLHEEHIRLKERIRQAAGLFFQLGHGNGDDKGLGGLDLDAVTDLHFSKSTISFTCSRCPATAVISLAEYPSVAYRGEAVTLRCKPTPMKASELDALVKALSVKP
jgi:hypothetical protein